MEIPATSWPSSTMQVGGKRPAMLRTDPDSEQARRLRRQGIMGPENIALAEFGLTLRERGVEPSLDLPQGYNKALSQAYLYLALDLDQGYQELNSHSFVAFAYEEAREAVSLRDGIEEIRSQWQRVFWTLDLAVSPRAQCDPHFDLAAHRDAFSDLCEQSIISWLDKTETLSQKHYRFLTDPGERRQFATRTLQMYQEQRDAIEADDLPYTPDDFRITMGWWKSELERLEQGDDLGKVITAWGHLPEELRGEILEAVRPHLDPPHP